MREDNHREVAKSHSAPKVGMIRVMEEGEVGQEEEEE